MDFLWLCHEGLVAPGHLGSQFLNQGLDPRPLHWKADSQLLHHQAMPQSSLFWTAFWLWLCLSPLPSTPATQGVLQCPALSQCLAPPQLRASHHISVLEATSAPPCLLTPACLPGLTLQSALSLGRSTVIFLATLPLCAPGT